MLLIYIFFILFRPLLNFCMKRVNMLRQYDINPILVFDGANLPMKHDTEKERKEYVANAHFN